MWIDIPVCVFACLTFQMTIAFHKLSFVTAIWKGKFKNVETLLCSSWLPNFIVTSTQEAGLYAFESLQVVRSDEVNKFSQVCPNMM